MAPGQILAVQRTDEACTGRRDKIRQLPDPFRSYEKKPRRRVRLDRYEPSKNETSGNAISRHGKTTREVVKTRRNSTRLMGEHCAQNIKARRLTLIKSENMGIFKKGKTSSPINSGKVLYPNFSEIGFLKKDPSPEKYTENASISQCHTKDVGMPLEKPLKTSHASMEGRIFRSLTDCRHLSIPYEEYIPTFPNCGLVSLEDLQELCKQSDFVRPKRPIASHLIHEINMNTDITMQFDESLEKENSNQLLLLSIACSGSPAQENGISDMLFQSIETLDEGVPLDVPGELIDVIQPYICEYELLQSAAAYADNSSNNMTQSLLCNGAHTLKDDCADEIAGISAMRTSNLTRGQYDSSWAPLGHRICLIGDSVGEANKPNCNSLNLEDILSSRRSETSHQHTHLPVCGTSHTLESILPSSRRPFWRCNKLY